MEAANARAAAKIEQVQAAVQRGVDLYCEEDYKGTSTAL